MNDKEKLDSDRFAQKILSKMSLREKIGQCFTVGFMDGFLRPDVLYAVKELNVAGLRLVPWERDGVAYKKGEDRCFKGGAMNENNGRRMGSAIYATPSQYADLLNQLQDMAVARSCGIPLHFSLDQEGDSYNDYTRGGVNLFPSNMGLAAMGDPELVREVFKAIGAQLRAVGVHFVHSPVLDVNMNPRNPEINFRSFSDDPELVAELGVQAMLGLKESGITAVAKHFPGRGDTDDDAHYDLSYYGHDRKQMNDIDLVPYKKLIENGLESIMTAHCVYTGLGEGDSPASVSKIIVNNLLRKEMGFEGIVTTDSITMLGLLNRYGLADACARALKAGTDLVLYRGKNEELPAVFDYIEEEVSEGHMDENVIDVAVSRVICFKKKIGLFDNPRTDSSRAGEPLKDPAIIKLSQDVPAKTAMFIKKGDVLPLKPSTKVLLAEQLSRYSWQCNDIWYHPGMLYENMLRLSDPGAVDIVECTTSGKDDFERIEQRIEKADVVVATSFYSRTSEHNIELIRRIVELGKPVVCMTNNPYVCRDLLICDTLLLIFTENPPGQRTVAEIMYGNIEPAGKWPLTLFQKPEAD